MPCYSMTPSMRLANRPWVPRLPRGGKPAPGAPLPARRRARLPARFARFVRFAGSHRSPPASRRRPGSSRPGSSRPGSSRFAPRSCVATQPPRAAPRGRDAAAARGRGKPGVERSRRADALGRNPSSARAGSGLALSALRAEAPPTRRLGAARGDAGVGRRALCGTPGTSRVTVRADGEGGLSSLRPGGQGANERW